MTPDEVCVRYADQQVKVTCRKLDEGFVLLEGGRESLEFLGQLLIAQANDPRSCSKSLGPRASGNALFTAESDLGLYIHRLPCEHGTNDDS